MEKPWWLSKKNEPAAEIDEDYDSLYYGKPDPDKNDPANSENTLQNGDDADISEVRVGFSDEVTEVAKAEPLMKRTFVPSTCEDSQDIVEAYKEGRIVIICVEELNRDNFLRLFDYVMGAVQALDGELCRVDRDTVVLLPYGVDEDLDLDEIEEEVLPEEETEEE